jgi:hypothetical protein
LAVSLPPRDLASLRRIISMQMSDAASSIVHGPSASHGLFGVWLHAVGVALAAERLCPFDDVRSQPYLHSLTFICMFEIFFDARLAAAGHFGIQSKGCISRQGATHRQTDRPTGVWCCGAGGMIHRALDPCAPRLLTMRTPPTPMQLTQEDAPTRVCPAWTDPSRTHVNISSRQSSFRAFCRFFID